MASYMIVACPDKSLAFTNKLYVAPNDPLLLNPTKANYVQIDSFVYEIASFPTMQPQTIGLSMPQRETLRVSQGASITVKAWKLPSPVKTAHLASISFMLDLAAAGRKSLSEDEIVQFLQRMFVNSMFNANQLVLVDYMGTAIKLQVQRLSVVASDDAAKRDGNLVAQSTCGLLQDFTVMDVDAVTTNKALTFKKSTSIKKSKLLDPSWKFEDMGIGGLDAEFNLLFRRAFSSRIFPPKLVQQLGIKHVRGMLLYGPPGTGKTLIARQIGKMLATREPKIVNGPEVLNKFVGQSEENIRKLFEDAEADQKANGDNSELHMIIFDEIDAICKARASKGGGDSGVGDTVVNQLLSKMDGVNSLNNILVVGMTNRKDLIDPALLRPGRLEVHIEINLPDEPGRLQILKIHTRVMRENGRLGPDVDLAHLAAVTKNFSGAELEGLVRSATSFALYGAIDVTSGKVGVDGTKDVMVTMAAFEQALEECKPNLGVDESELQGFVSDLYDYGPRFQKIMSTGAGLIQQVRHTQRQRLVTALLAGPVGTGKTSIAARLALDSAFPFVRIIRPQQFLGMLDTSKCRAIAQVFEDSYKSPLSCIVVDAIENLIEYIPSGPRFNNAVLQTLVAFCTQPPPHADRKLLVIATTNKPDMLEELGFSEVFEMIKVGQLTNSDEVKRVLQLIKVDIDGGDTELELISLSCPLPMSIRQLLNKVDFFTKGCNRTSITAEIWKD